MKRNPGNAHLRGVKRLPDAIKAEYACELLYPRRSILRGYWRLNETYVDSSGNEGRLVPHGETTFSTDVPSLAACVAGGPALSNAAVTILAGVLMGTAVWMIRRRRVARV